MVTALIVSGGKGTRMGSEIPKQFLLLDGIPILIRTLMKFVENDEIDHLVLVIPKGYYDYFLNLQYDFHKTIHLVEAGKERQDSVRNGLEFIENKGWEGIVVIHDGVRPLVSSEAVGNGIALCKIHRAAACGVKPKDTIKSRNPEGYSTGTLNRDELFLVQTPQVFHLEDILYSHRLIKERGMVSTDDTMVYEEIFGPVYLYEGSYDNIKITTKEDLLIASSLLSQK
ncbi:MAG: 2-C-methyl-D-erythritol 4-phosphate cytidylyltransferase [Clostridiaceae bacterium]